MVSFLNEDGVQALIWQNGQLLILDQRLLPNKVQYNTYTQAACVADAIQTMQVRGAPAIGIAAAYGLTLSVQQHFSNDHDWLSAVERDKAILAAARPTAVNLTWALELMYQKLLVTPDNPIAVAEAQAIAIHREDIKNNQKIGEVGVDIIGEAQGLLTHCNAGALATGGYGTALGVIRSAVRRRRRDIFASETRPWLQGARLTVWELAQDNIAVTLIADSAAAFLMKKGKIDWLIVGADRIAANGDVANKIGTYSLAVLAKQHGVKMMVVAPSSTLDFVLASGDDIEIEQRDSAEFLPGCYREQSDLVFAWNPVFDVTPAHLIDVIVTERGCAWYPFANGIMDLK